MKYFYILLRKLSIYSSDQKTCAETVNHVLAFPVKRPPHKEAIVGFYFSFVLFKILCYEIENISKIFSFKEFVA